MNGICSSHNGTKRESSRMSESIGSGNSSKELRTAFVMCWRSFNYGLTSFFLSNKPRQRGLIQRRLLFTESSQCNGCLAIYFSRLCSCQFVDPKLPCCYRLPPTVFTSILMIAKPSRDLISSWIFASGNFAGSLE